MIKKKTAEILLKVNAVTLNPANPYKFASGILSPIYCDNRILMSYPKEREKITFFFIDTIKQNKLKFDVVGGVETASISWASLVAEKLKKPMIFVRKKPKDHGKENLIEGKLEKKQRVLIIEDLVSTGGSSLNAINAVREQGGIVTDCIAIFTYEMEKAINAFKENKCSLFALSDFTTLIWTATNQKYIKAEEKKKVLEWNKNPEEWGRSQGFE